MKTILIIISAVLISAATFGQAQVDKKLQFTGSGNDAKIEGIDTLWNDHDAVNKIYVDTAIANRSPSSRYFIGDYYGGGIIVYVDSTQQHGYIGAKSIQSTGNVWSNIQNTPVGISAQSITNGSGNTAAIINQPGHSSSAAKVCDDYSAGGFTDWYLPSSNELAGACRMQGLFFNLSFYSNSANSVYWSSTENGSNEPDVRAIAVSFVSCEQQFNDNNFNVQKSQSRKVWCVRKF